MNLYRAELYREHKGVALLVQAKDPSEARAEVKRTWQGWTLDSMTPVFDLPMIWKIHEWTN